MESERAVGGRYRKLLAPLAAQQGLSYELELLSPGNAASQNAFHFVYCGASLLSFFTEPDSFPSEDRKTQRRGAKWMRKGFGDDGGRTAAIFLAQALATFLAETTKSAGHQADSEISLQLRNLIQDIYPLDQDATAQLEECRAEYRTRETFEVRPDISKGVQGASGYHVALLNRDFLDGMHPEEDPEMVEAQQRHASKYFRGMAGLIALKMVLSDKQFSTIEDDLFPPVGSSFASLGYDHASIARH